MPKKKLTGVLNLVRSIEGTRVTESNEAMSELIRAIDSLSLEEVVEAASKVPPQDWSGCNGSYSTYLIDPLVVSVREIDGVRKITVGKCLNEFEYDLDMTYDRDFVGPEVNSVYDNVCGMIKEHRLKTGWKGPV